MANEKTGFVVPPPPPNRLLRTQVVFAVLAVFLVFAAYVVESVGLLLALPLVGWLLWFLVRARRQEVGSHLALAALDRSARGRFDEARFLLDAVPTNVHGSVVGQMVFSQRAALALYEGKLDDAVSFATIAAREGKRLNAMERIHQGSALSIRAVAHAGLGHKEAALADAASVRRAELRQGGFVARAALAEALVCARDKDLDGLAKILREERALLFGGTGPRERLIARALARMVAAKRVSVYRETAKRDEDELDEQGSWVAKLAPEAATYAKSAKLGAPLEAPEEVSPEATKAAEKAQPKPKYPWKRVVALWAVLVMVVLLIWQMLQPTTRVVSETDDAVAPTSAVGTWTGLGAVYVAFFVFAAGLVYYRMRQAKRLGAALGAAIETRLRGDLDLARARFEELAKSKTTGVAPQAYRELATIATMTGDFRGAQTHAEAGIEATRTSQVSVAFARPVLLPMLHGELALAFAAEGRVARAEEELEKVRTGFPTYPFLAKDTFRTRLFAAAATGRLDEGAEMARSRPVDLPLSMDEELLCDMLRVQAGDPLPEGERERIESDVRDDTRASSFLDRIAPTLRNTAFRKGPRIAYAGDDKPYSEPPTSEEEADEEATEEKKKRLGLPT